MALKLSIPTYFGLRLIPNITFTALIGQNSYKVPHIINTFLPNSMKVLTQELAGAGNPLVKKPGKHEYRMRDDQSHPSY